MTDCIPVINFPAMSPVPFKKALWMIFTGRAKPVGPQGAETGLELTFSGLDAAVLSDKPVIASPCGHNARLDVSAFCGGDAFPGMPVLQPGPFTGNYTV